MNGKGMRQSILVCLLAGGILAVLLAGVWAFEVQAQDEGPVCPPGFDWRRMSGVGCVQSDCAQAGGRLTYTSACICNEGLKECSEPVDYANFDQALCGINCPGWRLTFCVPQDTLCPGEALPAEPEPSELEPPLGGSELRERVEQFIVGGHAPPPTAGRAAAAAVTGTVLMGLWTFLQSLGQQAPSMIKTGASDLRQAADKSGLEAPPTPDLRGTAGGLVKDAVVVYDKWPKGGKADEDPTILRPMDSDAGGVVYNGENVRLILIGMDKLPVNTTQLEALLIGEGGFAAFTGRHPDGTEQKITLVSGRNIEVLEVVSVGYEGIPPDHTGTVEIDFSPKLTLIARLDFEAPTILASEVDLSEVPTMMRKDLNEDQDEEDGEVQS